MTKSTAGLLRKHFWDFLRFRRLCWCQTNSVKSLKKYHVNKKQSQQQHSHFTVLFKYSPGLQMHQEASSESSRTEFCGQCRCSGLQTSTSPATAPTGTITVLCSAVKFMVEFKSANTWREKATQLAGEMVSASHRGLVMYDLLAATSADLWSNTAAIIIIIIVITWTHPLCPDRGFLIKFY